MSFERDLEKFAEKYQINSEKLFKKVAFDAFAGIMRETPVDTGALRGNWRIGINRPDTTIRENWTNNAQQGRYDREAYTAGTPVINSVELGQDIVISNSLDYAYDIEVNGKSKDKAPDGMVLVTVNRIKYDIKKAL